MPFPNILKTGLILAALAVLSGCSEPPVPPEVQLAQSQQQDLWRAGASVYAPAEFAAYQQALEAGRDLLLYEQGRWSWLRDYEKVRGGYSRVLDQGRQLLLQCTAIKDTERQAARSRLDRLERQFRLLRETAGALKDGRLAGKRLAIVEVELEESRRLIDSGQWREAEPSLDRAATELAEKIRRLQPLLGRYADPKQIGRWQELVRTVLAETHGSRTGQAIVISKLEKRLILYREGKEVSRFPVSFGYSYLSRKLFAGDRATPEGRYLVQAKNAGSRYFKALLLDYPNAEDRRRFAEASKAGQIPQPSGIGSLIEIHGGGLAGLTNGCIALEDSAMTTLFDKVAVGTPVVIVGSLVKDNSVAKAWAELQ